MEQGTAQAFEEPRGSSMELYRPQALPAELRLHEAPASLLGRAATVAKALEQMVEKTGSAVTIGSRRFLKVEAWQTLGFLFGLSARIVETRPVEREFASGWEAVAEVFLVSNGRVISRGEAECMTDEADWERRPKYERDRSAGKRTQVGWEPVPSNARRAMAQTRATSRAYRNALGWIAVLAKFDPTPAEEMPEEGTGEPGEKKQAGPQPQAKDASGPKTITEKQAKRLFALAKGAGMSDAELRTLLTEAGYQSTRQVTVADYEKLCAKVQGGKR